MLETQTLIHGKTIFSLLQWDKISLTNYATPNEVGLSSEWSMEPLTATIINAKMTSSHEMSAPGFAFSKTTLSVVLLNTIPKPSCVSWVVRIGAHSPRLSELTSMASITLKINVQNVMRFWFNFPMKYIICIFLKLQPCLIVVIRLPSKTWLWLPWMTFYFQGLLMTVKGFATKPGHSNAAVTLRKEIDVTWVGTTRSPWQVYPSQWTSALSTKKKSALEVSTKTVFFGIFWFS